MCVYSGGSEQGSVSFAVDWLAGWRTGYQTDHMHSFLFAEKNKEYGVLAGQTAKQYYPKVNTETCRQWQLHVARQSG